MEPAQLTETTPMTAPDNAPSHIHPLLQPSGKTVAQIVTQEHGVILLALNALEELIDDVEAGDTPDRAYFEKAVEFLRTFAARGHHGKEEDVLFKAMLEEMDYPKNVAPVAVLSTEHVKTRELIRGFAEAAAALDRDPTAPHRLIENGRGYLKLLRLHINREDRVVFPMVEQFMDEADQARLAGEFARFDRHEIESGRRAAALSLLEELTQRTVAPASRREPDAGAASAAEESPD
jgi:hemerythrin-like domain-containing protein